ncbi:MAG: hypothetical protein OCC49_20105 [Fibrobacterales bacterium]
MEFADLNVVEILNTGVTGFAFLLLFMSYRFSSRVQDKIFERDPSSFNSIEMYREWSKLVSKQLLNTRFFMIVALIFFAGGISMKLFQGSSQIVFSMNTDQEAHQPLVYLQDQEITFDGKTKTKITVIDGNNIDVDLSPLQAALHVATTNVGISTGNENTDAGF